MPDSMSLCDFVHFTGVIFLFFVLQFSVLFNDTLNDLLFRATYDGRSVGQ